MFDVAIATDAVIFMNKTAVVIKEKIQGEIFCKLDVNTERFY